MVKVNKFHFLNRLEILRQRRGKQLKCPYKFSMALSKKQKKQSKYFQLTKCNEEIEKENIFLGGVCLNKCDFNKH